MKLTQSDTSCLLSMWDCVGLHGIFAGNSRSYAVILDNVEDSNGSKRKQIKTYQHVFRYALIQCMAIATFSLSGSPLYNYYFVKKVGALLSKHLVRVSVIRSSGRVFGSWMRLADGFCDEHLRWHPVMP